MWVVVFNHFFFVGFDSYLGSHRGLDGTKGGKIESFWVELPDEIVAVPHGVS